jgi:hypothetical protein
MVQSISAGVTCRSCGKDSLYVGKLPAVGVHTAVHVFKCETCLTIRQTTVEMAELSMSSDGRAVFR